MLPVEISANVLHIHNFFPHWLNILTSQQKKPNCYFPWSVYRYTTHRWQRLNWSDPNSPFYWKNWKSPCTPSCAAGKCLFRLNTEKCTFVHCGKIGGQNVLIAVRAFRSYLTSFLNTHKQLKISPNIDI